MFCPGSEGDTLDMALVHELSWSVSRSGTFAECRRSYYLNYYLSWLGWGRSAPPERARAYLLKKLTRLPMHAGDCLHVALADWFGERARGRGHGPDWVRDKALQRLREGWKESRDRAADWERRPSKHVRLAEHYYGEPDIDETTDAAKRYGSRYVERIEEGTRQFFESPDLAPAREADPSTYLACEEMGTFPLFDTKIYAVPDFAYRDAEGRVRIWDWKTGQPREQDVFQLALYALYSEAVFGADPTEVWCADAYLPTGEVRAHTFDRAQLDATLERIQASMAEMSAVHFDADRGTGDAADFPMIPADAPEARACERCGFREICGR